MEVIREILVLPFYGQGHLFPSMELCKKFTSFNLKATLVIPSHLSSSIPAHFRSHSLIQVVEISAASTPPPPQHQKAIDLPLKGKGHGFMHGQHEQLGQGIDNFLLERCNGLDQTRVVCVVMDVMMSWSKEIFKKYDIPFVSFITSGACAAAMELAEWKNHVNEMKPGEIRVLPGLPETMAVSYSETKRRPRHGRPGHHRGGGLNGLNRQNDPSGPPARMKDGPPGPGQKPGWLDEIEGSIALFINTCYDLESSFIDYVADEIEQPIWGVGPLLPETYWKSPSSILLDHEVRPNRQSNYTEEEVMQWLNSKPQGSVIYVSFGSEVGPNLEEYAQLADALEASNHPFIWVIQAGSGRPGPPPGLFGGSQAEEGYYPHGLGERIGNRGLIIKGWAPQLMILSHPSTGGFLSHCGWNSTMEAIGRGIPILTWPIRGDQFHDAKLIVSYLKMGHVLVRGDDPGETVKKDDIVQGIDKLMNDEGIHKQAMALRTIFQSGYPNSSMCSLKSFIQLISK